MVDYAENGQIDAKIKNSLLSKIDAAIKGLADGKINSTVNQLGAFTNEVQAQRGKKINEAAADDLIAQAQIIIALLSATPTPELTLTPTEIPATATNSPTATLTFVPTETPTFTAIPSPTETLTNTPTFTAVPSPTLTLTPSLTPTLTFTPTETFTPLPTATETPPAGPLTITYTYDALRRLKSADYSDGRRFAYVYDANGNALEASGESTTTIYTYDAASQLVTAQKDLTVWHYVYDANGSLVEVLPNGNEVSTAKRYTYNTAGYLIKVEEHDGSGWNTQAEMTYNGLGTRMTSDALGVTTRYVSDGQLPLTIASSNKTITVLYGLGPVAEKTDEWSYVLTDGLNFSRQLTDTGGEVTLSVRYNPWGKPIETNGIGNFDASYIGTLIDATTGLIYIGNGQYYDPETGRFLTRGVFPNSTNPYVPWNPTGMLLGPLGLVSFYYSQKKGISKRRNRAVLIAILVLAMANLACCHGPSPAPAPTPEPSPSPTPTPSPVPNPNPIEPPPPPTPTPTPPPPCCSWLPDKVKFTRYVTVKENDTFFTPNDPTWSNAVHIEKTPGGKETTLTVVPVWRFYVGNADSPTWSVYWNGSGMLTESASLSLSNGQKYVKTDTNNKPPGFNAAYYFTDQLTGACNSALDANANIIAVAYNKFGTPGHSCGDRYYIDIPGFENKIFTVKDRGTFVVEDAKGEPDHFDLYVGIQDHNSFEASPLAQYDGQLVQIAKAQP